MPFPKEFYLQPTLLVAEQLLGQYVVYESPEGKMVGEINEVESYIGTEDPACHGAKGLNKRNVTLFAEGGFAYIYFTYGMYYCLNAVTEQKGFPSAVLIRSIIPITGIEIMRKNRNAGNAKKPIAEKNLTNGPGKICQAYGLTTKQDGFLLTQSPLFIEPSGKKIKHFSRTSRIGISKGLEHLWRFHYSA